MKAEQQNVAQLKHTWGKGFLNYTGIPSATFMY